MEYSLGADEGYRAEVKLGAIRNFTANEGFREYAGLWGSASLVRG